MCPGPLWKKRRWLPEHATIGGKGKTTGPAQGEAAEVRDTAGMAHREEVGLGEAIGPNERDPVRVTFRSVGSVLVAEGKQTPEGGGVFKRVFGTSP